MPADLQVVSPTEAIRKAFGLRGAFGMQVDETISPTVLIRQLDQSPYRVDGLGFVIGQSQAAVAAQIQSLHFSHQGSVFQNDIFVLDTLILSNGTAALQNIRVAFMLGLLAGSRTARTTEQAWNGGVGIPDFFQDTLLTVAPRSQVGSFSATNLTDVWVGAGLSLTIPLGGLILRGTNTLLVESVTVNSGVSATLIGRSFRGS
jgi:hypothetical protein